MAFVNPQVADFKARFNRDFPYSTDMNAGVMDADIMTAFGDTTLSIDPSIFPDQATYTFGYLLFSAHCLVLNIRASSQGLNGQYNWAQTQKSVQGVSETFQIPQRLLDNPLFMQLSKTNYGARFFELVYPLLTGQMFTVYGRTKP